jgi:hypothetical protein
VSLVTASSTSAVTQSAKATKEQNMMHDLKANVRATDQFPGRQLGNVPVY